MFFNKYLFGIGVRYDTDNNHCYFIVEEWCICKYVFKFIPKHLRGIRAFVWDLFTHLIDLI